MGIVLGLACYNGVIIDAHLPLPAYKKLMGLVSMARASWAMVASPNTGLFAVNVTAFYACTALPQAQNTSSTCDEAACCVYFFLKEGGVTSRRFAISDGMHMHFAWTLALCMHCCWHIVAL